MTGLQSLQSKLDAGDVAGALADCRAVLPGLRYGTGACAQFPAIRRASAVVNVCPEIPQAPLGTSSTITQVTGR